MDARSGISFNLVNRMYCEFKVLMFMFAGAMGWNQQTLSMCSRLHKTITVSSSFP